MCGRTAVSNSGKQRAADTLDIDSRVFTKTLILDRDNGFINVRVSDVAVGYLDPVDVLGTGEFSDDVVLAVIYERCL